MPRDIIRLTFPHEYECQLLDELPGCPGDSRLYYPGAGPGGRDGLILQVHPKNSPHWTGVFAFGHGYPSALSMVLSTPHPDRICVVSEGKAYLVSASTPTSGQELRLGPIRDVQLAQHLNLVLLADHVRILALGATGIQWTTHRVGFDGFRIVSITNHILHGDYWDHATGRPASFTVDLLSGTSQGGLGQ